MKLMGFDMRKFCVADSEAQAKSDVENQRENVFKTWKEAKLFLAKTSPNPPTRMIYCYMNGYLGVWSCDTTNQYVIASDPQDALDTFLHQSPYATYPTLEKAQERMEEMYLLHYGGKYTIYEICARYPYWSETKDYYFLADSKTQAKNLAVPSMSSYETLEAAREEQLRLLKHGHPKYKIFKRTFKITMTESFKDCREIPDM